MSNYNEDEDDDMFDDEADMVPQTSWVSAPQENSPAIDAVLNHRPNPDAPGVLRMCYLPWQLADNSTGKDIADLGRDDFEYYVGPG